MGVTVGVTGHDSGCDSGCDCGHDSGCDCGCDRGLLGVTTKLHSPDKTAFTLLVHVGPSGECLVW